jgi:rhodanese-related sulfurtransferase
MMRNFKIDTYRTSILLVIVLVLNLIALGSTQSVSVISPQEVKIKIDSTKKSIIIDVRSKTEFNAELGHISGAILRPLAEINQWIKEFEDRKNLEIIMVCRSGNRSSRATSYFQERGFSDVKNMSGGMLEWNKAKFPIEKNSSVNINAQ